jgi:serine/threonine protein kinase
MTISPGARLGRYEVRAHIGEGGMGQVYLAQDTQLGRVVALKVLPADVASDQQRMQRFIQEAKAASGLNHPNILTIYEIGQSDSVPFIATEFIEGDTLREHMIRSKVDLIGVLDLAIQTASALAAAHDAGIVHRDIKPENLMVRRDGYIKILDFGLAKISEPQVTDFEATTMVKTDSGIVMGTAHYMSPEQARGMEVDARTDLWSLGIVLYEMVAGRAPFAGSTTGDVIVSILEREPLPLLRYAPDVPAELERIIRKTLVKHREERYQTAKDLALDLKSLKQELEFEAKLKTSFDSGQRARASGSQSGGGARDTGSRRRSSRKAINSLAILPLVNASDDPGAEYLSDGITESIINSLSQLPRLRVMARSTVFRYKGKDVDPQEVGRDLDTRAVLTGRVFQLGGRLIIRTELVDAIDGRQLWGEQYNRDPSDILAVQQEIAEQISEKLRIKLSGEEKKRLAKRPTRNATAYELYLKGLHHWNKWTKEGFEKSIEYFEQAVAEDPGYALAYASLSAAHGALWHLGFLPARETLPKAEAAAFKALELDDTLAEPHVSIACYRMCSDWNWPGAGLEFRRAIELNSESAWAHQMYAFYLATIERHDESIAESRRARELDPLSPIVNAGLAMALFYARRYDEAIEQCRMTLELDQNFIIAREVLGMAYEQKGMYREAIAVQLQPQAILGIVTADMTALLEAAYREAGVSGYWRKRLELAKKLSEQNYVPTYAMAQLYAMNNEPDQAFEWLEKAYREHSSFMTHLRIAPRLDNLRSDPRFTELVRRVGIA